MSIESRSRQYGQVFDHWQIRKFLGDGSSGKTAVFSLVHSTSRSIRSALKVVSLIETEGNPNNDSAEMRNHYEQACERAKERAEQEVLLMNSLRGRTNIVDYLDHTFVDWEEDGRYGCDMLIRMELLQDLRSQIKERCMTGFQEAEILKIGKDICTALILCHSKHIIHRDIKPENIFFNEDGNYKLGDFGISKILSAAPLSQATTGIGTPPYLAPEQISGRYDNRIDIYSLGLVLYELCNQCLLPFASSPYVTESEIIPRLKGAPLPVPQNASPALAKVILKACAFHPEDRYQTVQEFLVALNSITVAPISAKLPVAPHTPKFCGKCGKKLDERTGKCINPQCPLGGHTDPPPSHKIDKKFFFVVLLLILCAGAYLFFYRSLIPEKDIPGFPMSNNLQSEETEAICSHKWQKATCSTSEICLICGETRGNALGHQWVAATYSSPKTCSLCGEAEGDVLGHVGDLIELGHYEQDNNVANGAEPIVWEILEIDGNNLFVICQYAIDCQRYHAKPVSTTWDTCSLRQWLNGTFYNAAFTSEEKGKILTTMVPADRNPQYNVNPGRSTNDKVYILSLSEAKNYFPQNSDRLYAATPYAVNQGAYVNVATGGSWWWLRTPGDSTKMAASVNSDGSIDYDGGSVATTPGTVLPVMWINMDEPISNK